MSGESQGKGLVPEGRCFAWQLRENSLLRMGLAWVLAAGFVFALLSQIQVTNPIQMSADGTLLSSVQLVPSLEDDGGSAWQNGFAEFPNWGHGVDDLPRLGISLSRLSLLEQGTEELSLYELPSESTEPIWPDLGGEEITLAEVESRATVAKNWAPEQQWGWGLLQEDELVADGEWLPELRPASRDFLVQLVLDSTGQVVLVREFGAAEMKAEVFGEIRKQLAQVQFSALEKGETMRVVNACFRVFVR